MYSAVCARADHVMVAEGATPGGFWVGPSRGRVVEAITDGRQHGHPETLVSRCAVPDGTCGAVWPVR